MTMIHQRVESLAFDDPQPLKHGLWFTQHLQVGLWHLNPGQRITTHLHPRADDLMVVVQGAGDYLYYPEGTGPTTAGCYEPSPTHVVVPPSTRPDDAGATRVTVGPGSVIATGAGAFHGLVNTGEGQLVVAVATGPDVTESVYVTR